MKTMTRRRIIGIALILFGIAFAVISIYLYHIHLHERYLHFDPSKIHPPLDTHWGFYWNFAKGNLLFSLGFGLIPVGIGLYMICARPWWYDPEIH